MPSDRFLSRWSKRKAQGRPRSRQGEPAGVTVAAAPDEADVDTNILIQDSVEAPPATLEPTTNDESDTTEMSEADLDAKVEELGLPALETLGPGSDFKPFMSGNVPKQLQNLALRKLWRSNPVLANVDGLVDYGEDFTDAARVVKNMQTAYQVGRGYLRDEEPETEEIPETEEEKQLVAEAEDPQTDDQGDVAPEDPEDQPAEPETSSATAGDSDETVIEANADTTLRNSISKI